MINLSLSLSVSPKTQTLKPRNCSSDLRLRIFRPSEQASDGALHLQAYGYAIWEAIQDYLNVKFKETGHSNMYFPQFIPYSFIEKEASHVEGFSPELALVTVGGGKELEEKLVASGSLLICSMLQGLNLRELRVRSLVAGLCLHSYQRISFTILQMVSLVTHSVGNCLKRAVVIAASIIFFQTPLSPVNSIGAGLALAGVFLYTRAKRIKPKPKAA